MAQKDKFAKGLGISAIFCVILRNLCSGCGLFDGSDAFPVALRVVVNFRKFLV